MPICFKCGKDLATDQSLQYHLQKRVPCNTLNCLKCKKQFPNKLLLDNHKHECLLENTTNADLRYYIYDKIQSKNIYIIEINNNSYKINYLSNNFEKYLNIKIKDIINSNINNLFQFDKNKSQIQHNDKTFNLDINYNDDNILLIETLVS